MATKSTIFKASLQIADIDHSYYADHALSMNRTISGRQTIRHCEERSNVAVHAGVLRCSWIAASLTLLSMNRTISGRQTIRHCEERSDVAVHAGVLRCSWIAASLTLLAMTIRGAPVHGQYSV